MAGRTTDMLSSAAFRALGPSGKLVLHAVEDALSRSGKPVALSLSSIMQRAGVCRVAARFGVRQCVHLGFFSIETGPRRVHVFAHSNGWRALDAEAAKQRGFSSGKTLKRQRSAGGGLKCLRASSH